MHAWVCTSSIYIAAFVGFSIYFSYTCSISVAERFRRLSLKILNKEYLFR